MARSPTSSEYLLFDAHPASATPYTPIDVTPRTSKSPIFTSVTCSGILYPAIVIELPMGITAIEVRAKITAINGAAIYSGLYTCGGGETSLKRKLMTSAARGGQPKRP